MKSQKTASLMIILSFSAILFGDWPDETVITSSNPQDDDRFGQAVSIDNYRCAIGAYGFENYKGAVDIYWHDGFNWLIDDRIQALDGTDFDRFGYSVAIDGELCAVGAYGKGAAYIFRKIGRDWVQEQKLVPSDDPRIFGYSVALEGDTCIIGSPTALVGGATKGAAYVFKYNGSIWQQVQKLSASDGDSGDQFGQAVSISGNSCLIGMPNEYIGENMCGSAYIFEYDSSSWIESEKLVPYGSIHTWQRYGESLCIDGNHCIIGASGDDQAAEGAGAAFVYYNNGADWLSNGVKIMAHDAAANDAFGESVAISGNEIVVGAYLTDEVGISSGSAYYFTKYGNEGFFVVEKAKIIASDTELKDYFGKSVDILNNRIIVGAPANYKEPAIGSAYIFDTTCPKADITGNCRVDFYDFVVLSEEWLDGVDWTNPAWQ